MSTTSQKLRGLVEFLYLKTEEGKVDWSLSGDRQGVWAIISDYRVEIGEDQLENFEKDIRVTVFNDTGDQVDTFSDSYFREVTPVQISLNSYYAVMSTLLEMAKRQASGADVAIEKILNSLGGSPISERPTAGGFATKAGGFVDDLDDDVPF